MGGFGLFLRDLFLRFCADSDEGLGATGDLWAGLGLCTHS